MAGIEGLSLGGSADEVRFKFLKTFHDDFRVRNGLGALSDPRVSLRCFGSFSSRGSRGSTASLASLASLDSLLSRGSLAALVRFGDGCGATTSSSECILERFCCRRYSSLRMVTARSRASMAESIQASKLMTLSSLLAKVRWWRKDAWTSMVRLCRAR